MKNTIKIILACVVLASCTGTNPTIQSNSPAAIVGTDLAVAATAAVADFATATSGGVNYAWAVSAGLNAYQTIVKTSADVKTLIAAWTAGKGMTLANRLATLFDTASGTPAQKVAALAKGAQAGAAATPTSP